MRMSIAYPSEFLKDPRGSITVEFVAIVPLFVAALVVGFEFGRAFWAYDVLTRDVRASVRYMTRNAVTPPPYASNMCPVSAENIAQTGSPSDNADANKHFPWKGVAATFTCPSVAFEAVCVSQPLCGFNDDGRIVTMTATVPLTLALGDVMNRVLNLSGSARIAPFSLRVSYQSRYIGN